MSNQPAIKEKTVEYEVNGETVKLSPNIIKDYLVSGNEEVTDQEVVMFLNLCRFQKLNPFLNEAYLVKFKGKPAQRIVSKEAFMKRAESHPEYAGIEAGIIVERNNEMIEIEGAIKLPADKLIGGWAKVFRKDREKPSITKIDIKEFTKGQATWNSMPMTMIRKTAIVNALREAFPDSLGAMYTEDDAEPGTVEIPVEQQVQEEINQKANKEIIDFDTTEQLPESTVTLGTEVNVIEKQEALFENLSDVTEPTRKRERDF